jgi:hypothetical protein
MCSIGRDGQVIGSSSRIILPGAPGWDGSLDGRYRRDLPGDGLSFLWGGGIFNRVSGGGSSGVFFEHTRSLETPQDPDVVKVVGRYMNCNKTAGEIMKEIQNDFSKFGNFRGSFGPYGSGVADARVDFTNPANFLASNVPIFEGGRILIKSAYLAMGLITNSINTSVTVHLVSSSGFTFETNPGHVLYPATISFAAQDTAKGQINFSIKITGNFAGFFEKRAFNNLGGDDLENKIWNNLLDNVKKACGQ